MTLCAFTVEPRHKLLEMFLCCLHLKLRHRWFLRSARILDVLLYSFSLPVEGHSSQMGHWVSVGFLYISMLRILSPSMCTTSKKGRLSTLTSSCVNLMLLSKVFTSVKASTFLVLFLTQVSSTNLNQWLGEVL